MNYFEDHIGDYAAATAHLTWDEDMAYTRLIRAYYHSEKPIPQGQAYRLARATTPTQRKAVDTVIAEFFTLEEDGYHQKRCDEEIARFHEKTPDRDAKRENERERQRRTRERRKQIFDALRDIGVVPAFDAPMSQLNALLSQHNITLESQPVTRDITPPVTRDDTATQTPVPRHQTPESASHSAREPSAYGAVTLALKAAGIAGNPSHPTLIALVDAGATPQEFVDAAPAANGKGKPFEYLLSVVAGRRQEAAALAKGLHKGAMPAPQGKAPTAAELRVFRSSPQIMDPTARARCEAFTNAGHTAPEPLNVIDMEAPNGLAIGLD